MNGDDSTIDDVDIPQNLKDTCVKAFSNFIDDPVDQDAISSAFEEYYVGIFGDIVTTVPTDETVTIIQNNNKVVQMNMDGNIIATSYQASFSDSKTQAKDILGSVEKISDTEVLIADAKNKRAIIVDVITQKILWEYNSDRYIVDAHICSEADVVIDVSDSSATNNDINIYLNQFVIWTNNSSEPLYIYSGDIGDKTAEGINLNSYGDIFTSPELFTQDRFAHKFAVENEYLWFSYPNLVKGTITVSKVRANTSSQFLILERDNLESPYSGRVVKVDSWGNILVTFGEGYLVKSSDAVPLLDNKILIST